MLNTTMLAKTVSKRFFGHSGYSVHNKLFEIW